MLPGARLQAAIEILGEIAERWRPAAEVLTDWGRTHRFAGSGDRAAIGTLVFDALRCKRSLSYRMDSETPRALVLGTLAFLWKFNEDKIDFLMTQAKYAPTMMTPEERFSIIYSSLDAASDSVRADIPEWLWPLFVKSFGERAVEEGAALTQRAPLDLRINMLKADRGKVLKALSSFKAKPTPLSALGVRILPPVRDGRGINLRSEAVFQRGWCEIQDEGSQVAALLTGAMPGMQVADICAGAGGKTLALAMLMENKGRIYAYDSDKNRFKGIFERLKRAGAHNVQTLRAGDTSALDALAGRLDMILIDAPCTGSGTWRRKPDAKWRLSERTMKERLAVQVALLDQAARFSKKGASIIYITCSLLERENHAQVSAFLGRNTDFVSASLEAGDLLSIDVKGKSSVQLTPACHETDGFFVSKFVRASG